MDERKKISWEVRNYFIFFLFIYIQKWNRQVKIITLSRVFMIYDVYIIHLWNYSYEGKEVRRVDVRPFEKWFEHEGNALEMEIRDYGGYR